MNSESPAGKASGCAQRSPTPPEILVCFALKEESAPFEKTAISRPDVRLLITGIGRKNAERRTRDFLETHGPALVLSCGFAGGLNPAIGLSTVLAETADPALLQRLTAAGARRAIFCCGGRVATTASEKAELWRTIGADAVEMESEAIQAVCRERGVACATVRVISDIAGEDLPLDFNRVSKPDLSLDYGKLALSIALAPWKIPALLKLRRQTTAAAKELARVLGRFLDVKVGNEKPSP